MDAPWPPSRPLDTRFFKPLLATAGAAFAVGIAYMDPGNWATDLDATRYGVTLLWSILGSGIAAACLQILVLRFTAQSDCDLMKAIVRKWPQRSKQLWVIYVFAIIATELAEFVGLVVGLQMLLGVSPSVAIGVAIAVFAVLLFFGGTKRRGFEAVAIITTAFLGLAYAVDLALLHPAFGPIAHGMLSPSLSGPGALVAVVGIVGATIMPHNLFLHSGLMHETLRRAHQKNSGSVLASAIIATGIALGVATLVNGAILIVGAATRATTIEGAFVALEPIAGRDAGILFGLGLIAAALAATASGVCAGDIICHDTAPIRLNLVQRRIAAVAPAVILLIIGATPTMLLLASQVALGLVLPTVIVPLLILVLSMPQKQTRIDLALIGCTSSILVATFACDGVLLQTLIPHS